MTGSQLGHYHVLEKLGEGGMGVVYKARDLSLDRFVAIKLLPPERFANADRRQRFIREARSASGLNHPNIITVHEIGVHDGADYIVMEYVAGQTLERSIVSGGMRVAEVLRIAVPVADGLARAHAAGIIHRDIKPGNIILGDDGSVKLLDFGLAKLTDAGETSETDATRTVQQRTEEGAVLGTVAYMSPEQAEGRKIDTRSDIFSFGAVLYEMVTGQRPFAGNSKLSTMAAILHAEPKPPSEVAALVPAGLERIIARCLRKDPAWRYQSAADLKVSLAELERESSTSMPAAKIAKPARRAPRWIAPLAAGLAIGAATVWWWTRGAGGDSSAYRIRPLTSYSGIEQDPALSPDGKQMAFSWSGRAKDNVDVYVQQVDGGATLRLTTASADDRHPAWSPDGQRIAFTRQGTVYVAPALGGPERFIAKFNSVIGPLSWTPDGRRLGVSANEPGKGRYLAIVSVETGEIRNLAAAPAGWEGDYSPAFRPDGRSLAFVRRKDLFSHSVLLQPLDTNGAPDGPAREITKASLSAGQVAWDRKGETLLASVTTAATPALARISLSGEVRFVGAESGSATYPSPAMTAERLAYQLQYQDNNIWTLDGPGPDGGPRPYDQCNGRVVVDSTAVDREPQPSPDGTRLLFTSYRTGSNEIYVASSDGNDVEQLTAIGPRFAGSPRWSRDGAWIAFDRVENGPAQIYVVRGQGGKARPLTRRPGSQIRPSWSHDGKWIYYTSSQTGRLEIWKVGWNGGVETGEPVQMTRDGGNEAFESPDGRELFFNGPGGALWSMPVSGGPPSHVLAGVIVGRWALAGRSVYILKNNPRSIWVHRRDTGKTFEYVRLPDAVRWSSGTLIAVTPDERRIYWAQVDREESDIMLLENFR